MSIEPTEEQKQAAKKVAYATRPDYLPNLVDAIARLLAEREAKLLEEMERLHRAVVDTICDTQDAENDTLRARVAELEAEARAGWADLNDCIAEMKESEAQHLADIKALREFLGDREEEEGIWIPRSEFNAMPRLAQPAHYDDAKADAPASTEGGEG